MNFRDLFTIYLSNSDYKLLKYKMAACLLSPSMLPNGDGEPFNTFCGEIADANLDSNLILALLLSNQSQM